MYGQPIDELRDKRHILYKEVSHFKIKSPSSKMAIHIIMSFKRLISLTCTPLQLRRGNYIVCLSSCRGPQSPVVMKAELDALQSENPRLLNENNYLHLQIIEAFPDRKDSQQVMPIAYCLLPLAFWVSPIAYCLVAIAQCLLPIAYC